MRVILGSALAALLLAGCQTDAATPSGSPEITVSGRPDQVKPAVVNAALNRGMKMRGDTAYTATFERPWGGTAGSHLVGTMLSSDLSPAIERMTFSFAEAGSGTRVVLDRYMVRAGRYGKEQITLANGAAPGLEPVQATLDQIAASLPSRR